MMSNENGQALHDKLSRGEALSDQEQSELEEWYAGLDQQQSAALGTFDRPVLTESSRAPSFKTAPVENLSPARQRKSFGWVVYVAGTLAAALAIGLGAIAVFKSADKAPTEHQVATKNADELSTKLNGTWYYLYGQNDMEDEVALRLIHDSRHGGFSTQEMKRAMWGLSKFGDRLIVFVGFTAERQVQACGALFNGQSFRRLKTSDLDGCQGTWNLADAIEDRYEIDADVKWQSDTAKSNLQLGLCFADEGTLQLYLGEDADSFAVFHPSEVKEWPFEPARGME